MSRLQWWTVAWFLLSMVVSSAASIVQPRPMELICSGTGVAKLISLSETDGTGSDAPGMDCSLCLLGSAPPDASYPSLPLLPLAGQGPTAWQAPVFIANLVGPPPARGPPSFSS